MLKTNDAFSCFASEAKLQFSAEKVVTIAANAAQSKTAFKKTKRSRDYVLGRKRLRGIAAAIDADRQDFNNPNSKRLLALRNQKASYLAPRDWTKYERDYLVLRR